MMHQQEGFGDDINTNSDGVDYKVDTQPAGGNNGATITNVYERRRYDSGAATFDVYVSKDTFKFNAAHFVAFDGYRERLHGHNYRVGLRLSGNSTIGRDGYVIDFGCIKDVCKRVCKTMNEHFLVPTRSDVLVITHEGTDDSTSSVRIQCQDESVFVFPRQDCLLLPIVHATTEEIAIYLWSELLEGFNSEYLLQRGIHTMEVTVAEAPGQEATFRLGIAEGLRGGTKLDVGAFITKGELVPLPCLVDTSKREKSCCPNCSNSTQLLSAQLKQLAQAYNNGRLSGSNVSADDLATLIRTG